MDSRPKLFLDWEIRSEVDVSDVGVYVQAEHPSTVPLVLGYSVEGHGVKQWHPTDRIPDELLDDRYKLVAHNANYDRIMTDKFIRKTRIEDWDDTSMRCRYYGFPAGLDEAATVLLGAGKDPRGKELIRLLCRPQKDRKTGRTYWCNDPDKLAEMDEYNVVDIERLKGIDALLGPLPIVEQRCWEMFERINDRGICIDLQLARAAVDLFREVKEWSGDLLSQITGGELSSFTQAIAIRNWINRELRTAASWEDLPGSVYPGPQLESVDVDHIKAALDGEYGSLPQKVRHLLELKGTLAKASIAKYPPMLARTNTDCRARGTSYHYGARTGRATSKGIQIHNLERGKEKHYLWAIEAVKERNPGEALWFDWANYLGPAVRGALLPTPGNYLLASDYSNIEGRCFGWIAGDEEDLDRFRKNIDIYKIIAGQIYLKPSTDILDHERSVGKETRLSGQYGVGWKTHQGRLKKWGIVVSDGQAKHNIRTYRETNWRAPILWKDLEDAWRSACAGVPAMAGKCSFRVENGWMILGLPGGRNLYFYGPTAEKDLAYTRLDRRMAKKNGGDFVKNRVYGGMIAENICQTMAGIIARDHMLEIERKGIMDLVFMVHDELVGEVPIFEAEDRLRGVIDVMTSPPLWAPDLPLSVEAWYGPRYRKG